MLNLYALPPISAPLFFTTEIVAVTEPAVTAEADAATTTELSSIAVEPVKFVVTAA